MIKLSVNHKFYNLSINLDLNSLESVNKIQSIIIRYWDHPN